MHWKPQERQGAEPEEEERHEIRRVRSRRRRHRVVSAILGVAIPRGPDGSNHEIDAVATYPGLDAVPDTSHYASVQDGPQGTPDAEAGSVDDWERYLPCRASASAVGSQV